MGPAKWPERALKQRRHCQSRTPTQLDSFAQFNMTKTLALFPNSTCHTGPCATLTAVSLSELPCLSGWHRLVTRIQTHAVCSPFHTSCTNMRPVSSFPGAWNILHICESSSFPESRLSSVASVGNYFHSFFGGGGGVICCCFLSGGTEFQPGSASVFQTKDAALSAAHMQRSLQITGDRGPRKHHRRDIKWRRIVGKCQIFINTEFKPVWASILHSSCTYVKL